MPIGSVVLYTRQGCPFCHQAKRRLKRHRLPFKEVRVAAGAPRPALPDGRRDYTFPQMFLGVGGSDAMDAWLPKAARRRARVRSA